MKLSQEHEQRLKASIKRFFDEVLEDEIGDLKATLVLDFCLKEIGPAIYNRAIDDARAYMLDRLADLDGSCYEPEDVYWSARESSER